MSDVGDDPRSVSARMAIRRALDDILMTPGFHRVSTTWTRESNDGHELIMLQRSRWASVVYVNVGVHYLPLEPRFGGHVADCHVRTRLESLVGFTPDVAESLDLLSPLSDHERGYRVADAVTRLALPWLEGVRDIGNAGSFLQRRTSKAVIVAPPVRAALVADQRPN